MKTNCPIRDYLLDCYNFTTGVTPTPPAMPSDSSAWEKYKVRCPFFFSSRCCAMLMLRFITHYPGDPSDFIKRAGEVLDLYSDNDSTLD